MTNTVTLMIISVFAFVPLLLAEIARTKSFPTTVDFILQRRNLGVFSMYATVFATWMSAFAFIGAITYFYTEGPIYMTTIAWDALFALLFAVVGRRLWYYGKIHKYMTPRDFFNDIYGSEFLNIIVTVISIVSTMIYLQVQILGGFMVLNIFSRGQMSLHLSSMIFFIILVIYIWAGGLRAVTMTDIFYGVIIIFAILSSGIFLINVSGGIEQTFDTLINMNPSNVSMVGGEKAEKVAMWVSLFIIVPVGAFMGPQIWIRNYASSKEKNFNILPFLLYISSIVFMGTLFAGSASVVLSGEVSNPDSILVYLLFKHAHPFFTAFIIIGIYAALFSTANSQVHALAAVYTIDIHRRYMNRKAPDKKLLAVSKWSVLIFAAISYLFVFIIPRSIAGLGVAALGGASHLFIPVLGAFFWPQSTSKGAIAGIVLGETTFIVSLIFSNLDASISAIIGLFLNALLFFFVSIISKEYPTAAKINRYRKEYLSRKVQY